MEDLCFCGSGKPYASCHGYINKNSFVANLYRLQNDIDDEIEKQKNEKQLSFSCEVGCDECCSQCLCISETEFVQILEYMNRFWTINQKIEIIKKSIEQWNILKEQYPEKAQKLESAITLKELFHLDRLKLPFPCIFLNEKHCCSIYNIRPLVCRMYGIGYSNLYYNHNPCSKIPSLHDGNFINLSEYDKQIIHFIFLKHETETIIRRPVPLFYYFYLIFKDTKNIQNITDLKFYNDLLRLSEEEYISELVTKKPK